MKHRIHATKVVAFVGGMVVFGGIGFAQCKMAVVDIQAAVVGSNDGGAQSAKFDARVAEWKAKLANIHAEIANARMKLNSQTGIPDQTFIADLNKTIRDKTSELTLTESDAQKDVDNYRDSLLDPLRRVAAEIAETVAVEKGFGSVVDSSTTPTTRLPAGASKDCDITAEVKTRMNARSAAGTPAK